MIQAASVTVFQPLATVSFFKDAHMNWLKSSPRDF